MNNTVHTVSSTCDIDKLYPALVECFVIILLGYVCGRLGLISPSQSKGIGNFVSLFALPALLFRSMATLDLSDVNWKFLAAILISKGMVFAIVAILTIILGKPQKYGRAGIYAIFCTQSNDFALGIPLIKALYGDSMPGLVNYIYLLAPISLVILNPIGFILMEFNKHHGSDRHVKKTHIAMATIKGVITNPIVFMTFIGVIANFILHQKIPAILDGFLSVLGSAFFASALFFLGLKMVGNMKKQMGYGLVVPFLLIFSKLMLLPLCVREVSQLLDVGGANSTLTDTWSMFGFLYGTIPTAPTVVIFAAKFALEEEKIATGMVLGTFLSAPILYTSAKLISSRYTPHTRTVYTNIVNQTIQDSCGVSIPFGVWVIVMFILSRRYKIFPQRFTLWLALSQVAYAVCSLLVDVNSSKGWHYVSFTLVSLTELMCRGWTAMVAFSLCLVRCNHGTIKTWKPYIYLYAVGVALMLTGIKLCFLDVNQPDSDSQSFISFAQNQTSSLIIQVIGLCLDFIVIIISLVRLQRCDKYCQCPAEIKKCLTTNATKFDESTARCHSCVERDNKASNLSTSVDLESSRCCSANQQSSANTVDIESLDESTCLLSSNTVRYLDSQSTEIDKLETELTIEEYYDGDKHQLVQHVILVLCLAFSICLGLFMCLWYLLDESRECGLFIGMKILDTIFLFGQGFIMFACFGMDKQLIIVPCVKRFRRLVYGGDNVILPSRDDLSPEEIHTCEQFMKHHQQKCKRALVSNKRYILGTYRNAFSGEDLVSWLTDLGLAADRQSATYYANTLLRGRVIEHVSQEHLFYDLPYFYRFC